LTENIFNIYSVSIERYDPKEYTERLNREIYIITVVKSNLIKSKLMSVFEIINGAEKKIKISYKFNKRVL